MFYINKTKYSIAHLKVMESQKWFLNCYTKLKNIFWCKLLVQLTSFLKNKI